MSAARGKAVAPNFDPSQEQAVGISAHELTQVYILASVKGFGPQKFKELHKNLIDPFDVVGNPNALPTPGKTGEKLRNEIAKIPTSIKDLCKARAEKQIAVAFKHNAKILTYRHQLYPRHVLESNNPVPVLYVRGNDDILLNRATVACVGSRKIRPPYTLLQQEFTRLAVEKRFTVVSGFAVGADTVAHKAAVEHHGTTICVMPCGLDRPFPPENRILWNEWIAGSKALFATEFPFGTGASTLNLRKRNKLIVAFAQGVLVAQSATDGGAMNAYRFAREQDKPVATFQQDGTVETSGNKLIETELENRDQVFPAIPKSEAYQTWLVRLSSVI